jgi:hypothetical protein
MGNILINFFQKFNSQFYFSFLSYEQNKALLLKLQFYFASLDFARVRTLREYKFI